MKIFGALVASTLFAVLTVAPASAQQPGTATDPYHPAPSAAEAPGTAPAPAPGMRPGATEMMGMCHHMMGDMMSMPMMGAGMGMDPKDRADMLEMRGEMMKAMGDIMIRHARRMRGTSK